MSDALDNNDDAPDYTAAAFAITARWRHLFLFWLNEEKDKLRGAAREDGAGETGGDEA